MAASTGWPRVAKIAGAGALLAGLIWGATALADDGERSPTANPAAQTSGGSGPDSTPAPTGAGATSAPQPSAETPPPAESPDPTEEPAPSTPPAADPDAPEDTSTAAEGEASEAPVPEQAEEAVVGALGAAQGLPAADPDADSSDGSAADEESAAVAAVRDDLAQVATGPMLAELEAQLVELDSQGWTQEGAPELSEVTVISGDGTEGDTLVIEACVDYSAVVYRQSDGSELPANPTPRSRNIFTLTAGDDGAWVLQNRELTDDPAC